MSSSGLLVLDAFGNAYDTYVRLIMRCAVYVRVSTTDQTCESQLKELREYISRRGWQNSREYVDTGFSGSKASRPALDRLMADAAQRKFDCVTVLQDRPIRAFGPSPEPTACSIDEFRRPIHRD